MLRPASPDLETSWDVFGPNARLTAAWFDASQSSVSDRLWERAVREPLRDFLSRPGKDFRGNLVRLSWALADSDQEMPPNLPLLIELIHAGSLIVDDIQDDSAQRRGRPTLHRRHGVPIALNCGSSLYFWPFALLSNMGLAPERELDVFRRTTRAMLRCHQGQALDLATRASAVEQAEIPSLAFCIAATKTGALTALAASIGAAAAGGTAERIAALEEFGSSFGVALQMLNDLADVSGASGEEKAFEDLRADRLTFCWAWLAEKCDALKFARHRIAARTVFDEHYDPGPFAAAMLAEFGDLPNLQVSQILQSSLTRLKTITGERPEIQDLEVEISRLAGRRIPRGAMDAA